MYMCELQVTVGIVMLSRRISPVLGERQLGEHYCSTLSSECRSILGANGVEVDRPFTANVDLHND